jgi:hypothetical protein
VTSRLRLIEGDRLPRRRDRLRRRGVLHQDIHRHAGLVENEPDAIGEPRAREPAPPSSEKLRTGTYHLTATYGASTNFNGSTSTRLTVTVLK